MVKLIEQCNERGTRLLSELREEIKQKDTYEYIKPIAPIKSSVGIFKSTRVYGNCRRDTFLGETNYFEIALNQELIKNGTDEQIKDILMHELIHTTQGCFNHKSTFKHKARICKSVFGYDALHGRYPNCLLHRERKYYTYRCVECGITFKRQRKMNLNRYHCAKCKGKFELVE